MSFHRPTTFESIHRQPSGSHFFRRLALGLACCAWTIALVGCATKPAPVSSTPSKAASPTSSKTDSPAEPKTNTKPSTSKKAAKSGSRAKPADPQPATVAKADRSFLRPASGTVIARFDGRANKGVDFAGSKGDSVHAARDGKVVYAAVGPRGYGQLIMIKHDATYVTAYAHNSQLLVKEGQSVKRGQVIARMGDTEANRVKLHFELRKNGNAVDPALYLESADASAASPERDQRNEQ